MPNDVFKTQRQENANVGYANWLNDSWTITLIQKLKFIHQAKINKAKILSNNVVTEHEKTMLIKYVADAALIDKLLTMINNNAQTLD